MLELDAGLLRDEFGRQVRAGQRVGGTVGQLDDLVAAGAAGADLFIAGPCGLAVAVAGLDVGDAALS